MRALIMSDLHAMGERFLLPEEKFDCILLCGDNAETDEGFPYHHALFKDIREQFSGPVGFVVGNHDLWVPGGENSWGILYNKMPELAERYNLHYLETENLVIDDWTIAGTYGHYDYSFGRVSEEIAKKGRYDSSQGILTWRDIKEMRWREATDADVCHALLDNFSLRLKDIDKKKLVTVSHTIPHRLLVGHPNSEIEKFFSCYSGSKRLGEILREEGGVAHYCGHTHAEARATLGITNVVNIGNDFGKRKYALFDSELLK